jgi:hypothetical protein
MTRYIRTADDGRITEVREDAPDGDDWIEITELAYLSDAAPDGHTATRYYKPDGRDARGRLGNRIRNAGEGLYRGVAPARLVTRCRCRPQ